MNQFHEINEIQVICLSFENETRRSYLEVCAMESMEAKEEEIGGKGVYKAGATTSGSPYLKVGALFHFIPFNPATHILFSSNQVSDPSSCRCCQEFLVGKLRWMDRF
ncbi:hypothetical protein MKW98_032399 [Papaver atlanticum]|uniref:Uncharacterized protein n=1 Tax=Papaver atlanticum TaxID=357466 RepID=A0AAD4SU61_9MAGN|nr:hypothetical protein MKW98_032399 [Papaver atlanticum]